MKTCFPIKNVLILFLTLNCFSQAYPQGQVTGVTFIPPAPTELDAIKVIGEIMMYNSACPLISISCSQTGPTTIDVMAYHCYGMMTLICNATDTCDLPPLAPGVYSVAFCLWAGTPCPSPGSFTNADTYYQTLTVSPVTGINEKLTDMTTPLFPNPCDGNFTLTHAGDEGTLLVLSPDGRMLKALVIIPGTNHFFLGLPSGLYIAVIKTRDGSYKFQTLAITG